MSQRALVKGTKKGLPSAMDLATSIPAWLDLPEPRGFRPKRKLRTVWISDIHLGTRGCNATMLLDFLSAIECETLYLVGDIVDGWRLSKGWYWPDEHNEVVRRILKMAHRGTRVVLIAGNHDEMLRPYAGMSFGGVELATGLTGWCSMPAGWRFWVTRPTKCCSRPTAGST